jgi:hypothetical protein
VQENGYKYFSFSRALVTTDPNDLPITPSRPQYLIHALGPGVRIGLASPL